MLIISTAEVLPLKKPGRFRNQTCQKLLKALITEGLFMLWPKMLIISTAEVLPLKKSGRFRNQTCQKLLKALITEGLFLNLPNFLSGNTSAVDIISIYGQSIN